MIYTNKSAANDSPISAVVPSNKNTESYIAVLASVARCVRVPDGGRALGVCMPAGPVSPNADRPQTGRRQRYNASKNQSGRHIIKAGQRKQRTEVKLKLDDNASSK